MYTTPSLTLSHREKKEREERRQLKHKKLEMARNTTSAKKAIAKEQIQDLLTKEIRPKEKWEICSDCKIEVIDMAGHEDVLHKKKFKKFNDDGVCLLIHCPLGLPDPKLFLAKQHLLDHINDVYARVDRALL